MPPKYVSDGTWFDYGTEAKLLVDLRPGLDCGVFIGTRHGMQDEEVCTFDEFTVSESAPADDPDRGNGD